MNSRTMRKSSLKLENVKGYAKFPNNAQRSQPYDIAHEYRQELIHRRI